MRTERKRVGRWGLSSGVGLLAAVLLLYPMTAAFGGSTTKSLSTNYTVMNFDPLTDASVGAQYQKTDGSQWNADPANTNFTVLKDGGQAIIRQYSDSTMTAGAGSAVVSSTTQLGAVVQIQARGQVATSGAYSGISTGSSTWYVPLAARNLNTASGLANSQIAIQSTETLNSVSVTVQLLGDAGNYTKPSFSLAPGVTYLYDLADETNLSANWVGSAVVTATGGLIGVVSNFFTGPDALQTFNAFPAASLGTNWLVPIFTSRLANNLSTVVTVQNLSGNQIDIGGIQLNCTKGEGSPNPANFSASNPSAIQNNKSYSFNPVTDFSNFPTSQWFGTCTLTSGANNTVAIVQMRYVPGSAAAAYEAIPAGGTSTTTIVPLVAKRLTNNFASVVNIQNLSPTNPANVTFTYKPSADYINGGGSSSNIVVGPYQIPAGAGIQHNHRVPGNGTGTGQHNLPDGWFGSLTVSSSDQPINGIVQLTYIGNPSGDWFMAHNAFTQ
jgi:hypothetical protein